MNQIHLQTVLASKAARVVTAAAGRRVIDFGSRRSHGLDAAIHGARACYVAGVHGTSNVLAGRRFGIPVAGTMAHSYIQAHHSEREAFRSFAAAFPGTVLLVDTYDTLSGVRQVIDMMTGPAPPPRISAIRLDSGDILALARESRRLMDQAGLHGIQIFASGGLDEYEISRLVAAGAPIDGFGVGTGMSVSTDEPALDIVYKLTEYAGVGRTKLSEGKPVLPGRKQVYRREPGARDSVGGDVIGRCDEVLEGRPLLEMVMEGGRRLMPGDDLEAARARAARELASLPRELTTIGTPSRPYPVTISAALQRHHEEVCRRMRP
jgi:nicotinate phosphoribosyltransferase